MSDKLDSNAELVQKSLRELLIGELLFPWLYEPFHHLDTFLRQNTHLFTLIGVFGAVTIYLRNFAQQAGESIQISTVAIAFSGFSVVLLLSGLVLVKLSKKGYEIDGWYNRIGIIIFLIAFVPLVLILLGMISQFSNIWAAVYVVISIYVGMFLPALPLRMLAYISEHIGERYGRPNVTFAIGLLLMMGAVLFIAATRPIFFSGFSGLPSEGGISLVNLFNLLFGLTMSFLLLYSLIILSVTLLAFLGGATVPIVVKVVKIFKERIRR